jgi:hypothetical protein
MIEQMPNRRQHTAIVIGHDRRAAKLGHERADHHQRHAGACQLQKLGWPRNIVNSDPAIDLSPGEFGRA